MATIESNELIETGIREQKKVIEPMHTPIFSRCSPAVFRSPAILPPATLSTAYGAFSSKTYFKHLFQGIYLEFKYSVVCYNLTVPLNRAGLDQPSPVLCPKT